MLLSEFNRETSGLPESYFTQRACELDFRGGLAISAKSYWGFWVTVITQSHDISTGEFSGPAIDRPVRVDDYAWICSKTILYNCHVKHHAIVALGAVVANMTVEPYTMVAGNPARVVARWNAETKKWEKV